MFFPHIEDSGVFAVYVSNRGVGLCRPSPLCVPFTSSAVTKGSANSASRRPGDLTLSSGTAALFSGRRPRGAGRQRSLHNLSASWPETVRVTDVNIIFVTLQASKQIIFFFLKECCMQSVECKNVVSDLSGACSLEGMLRQLTHPTRAEARQGGERTRMCLHFCVCVHAHTRVTDWPLFSWMSPLCLPSDLN